MSVLPVIEAEFVVTGKARIEVRPIAFLGEKSGTAAQGAECANDQGRFWDFHDMLYANQKRKGQSPFSREDLKRFASALGLDTAAFGSCMDSEKYAKKVEKDTVVAQGQGINSTPTIFVHGKKVEATADALRAAIQAELADVNATTGLPREPLPGNN